eukprot:5054981-Pyramimonas_sp.AAC.1
MAPTIGPLSGGAGGALAAVLGASRLDGLHQRETPISGWFSPLGSTRNPGARGPGAHRNRAGTGNLEPRNPQAGTREPSLLPKWPNLSTSARAPSVRAPIVEERWAARLWEGKWIYAGPAPWAMQAMGGVGAFARLCSKTGVRHFHRRSDLDTRARGADDWELKAQFEVDTLARARRSE